MAKAAKAVIESKVQPDGAVSHKIVFVNGETRLILIKKNHPLTNQFVATGSKVKCLAAINSVDTVEKAIAKIDALEKAFDEGKWSLQAEGDGKPKVGALVQALAAIKGITLEAASAHAATLSRAEQAKLRAHPTVAAKILEIEGDERVKEGEDLLESFLAPGINHKDKEAA